MRSYGLVLAWILAVWVLKAGGQETASLAPLPEGNTGIAAKYPGDHGIDKDPAVVFADDFESGTTDKWDTHYGVHSVTHEPENVHSGKSAVEFAMVWPRPDGRSNGGLMQHFKPGFDLVFWRYYAKISKNTELYGGGTHAGGAIWATTMESAYIKAGLRADGKNQFTARLDHSRPNNQIPSPGQLVLYSYHPGQATIYGDQLFPSGRILPRQRPTGQFYGKEFVSRPDIIPEQDRWYCYEIMVKVNTLGKHDGRMAFWVDGKLAADFPNFYLRDIEELKANLLNISFFTQNRRVQGRCVMWYDDVVAATSYIGPMVEEKKPAALLPLPEGNTGIAAKYPGDVGIQRDPAVVFHDDFEDCSKPADLHKKWEMVIHETNMRIAEEAANVGHGKKALECAIPQQRADLATGVHKQIKDERDVLFLRFYSKYEKGFDQHGSCHSGGTISAHYQLGHTSTPGVPADGLNKFLANFETERGNSPSPGLLNIYCYHPEQRGRFGDHIYPSGKILPVLEAPDPFGPEFVPRRDFIPELDRWYCYEFMVKGNTPGQRDGRIACWVDGKLIADFPNFRLRDIETLKIDWFGVGLYMSPNTLRANKKWFDDVVAATSYIGPLVEEKK